ncbi:hypothetical protein CJF30_00006811 [Rutstroemia sp. NJR-2017a BBW]|nr:hypothetical protein CJF30_00006811 [Rutstroemia sp. NJR-2017a BBW]
MSSSGSRSYTLQPPVIHQQDQHSSDSESYRSHRKYIEVTENRAPKKPVKIIDHGESKGHYDPAEPTSREAHAAPKKTRHEKKGSQKSSH